QLMSTIPGLFVIGEANFSDHGANRLGASALMQGLADGYFVLPYTIGDYLASTKLEKVDAENPASRQALSAAVELTSKLLSIQGSRSVDSFHRELGKLLWEYCGMARNAEGLEYALKRIPELREDCWKYVRCLGTVDELSRSLGKASRLTDFLEFGEMMFMSAAPRAASCPSLSC